MSSSPSGRSTGRRRGNEIAGEMRESTPANSLPGTPGPTPQVGPARSGDMPGYSSLRIALVCPYSLSRPGGVQGQVLGMARVLGERGHRATVFAPVDQAAEIPATIDLVRTGHSVSLPSNGSRAPVSISPRAVIHGVRALRSRRFDVVHVHEPFSPGLPYGLLLAADIPPLVATFHRSGGSFFYSAFRPLTTRMARRIAVRCAVSEAARDTAAQAMGGRYEVLFNGVEIDRYRRADPWPKGGPTVLFLGRHEERKGLEVLLDAFGMMTRASGAQGHAISAGAVGTADIGGSDLGDGRPHLWVAGNGPETERLRRLHPESPLVHWLGILSEEEKLRRLAAADVLCAPSLGGESFGMVLLEAMASGCVVVASDIDGYRNAVGSDAVLVPPRNPSALAEALRAELRIDPEAVVLNGNGSRDHRLASATRRAEAWSMSHLVDRYEKLYRLVSVPPRQ